MSVYSRAGAAEGRREGHRAPGLLDAGTGVVKAIRLVSLSPVFSRALAQAVQAQALAMPKRKIDWYGPRLREVRERRGLSQAELRRRVDLAGSHINKLETNVNQPTLATALALAEALGVPITDFIPPGTSFAPHDGEPASPRGRPPASPAENPPGQKPKRPKGRKREG